MPTERQILRTMQKEIEKRNDFLFPQLIMQMVHKKTLHIFGLVGKEI